MSVAVTGAGGFLGRLVVDALENAGVRVIALSRSLQKTSFGHTIEADVFNLSEADLALLAEADCLLHLAWDGLPNYQSMNHIDQLAGHYQFLKRVIGAGQKNIVVAGTCFEYGQQNGCLDECTAPKPNTIYGLAKYQLLQQMVALQNSREFNLTWLRPFFMYGAGQSEKSLYSLFVKAVAEQNDSFPMSGGQQLRDFLAAEQVAQYMARLALLKSNLGVVNICSGEPTSVRSLVESWRDAMGADIELDLGVYPYSEYEPMAYWGCVKKLNRVLEGEL